ncbi:unnamed protein product [Cylicocyclus nassatus]|uniref:Uncharacterized protein n=1 Tax=Cylicocyclus nassatus TaxID=53992 RepID=A0AA36GI89_CYLNA|nr:unnamed protein product [Cylicocyclus nassatus]
MSPVSFFFASLVFLVAYSHAGMGPMGPMGPGPMGSGPMGPGSMVPAKGFIKGAPYPGPLFGGPVSYPVGPIAYDPLPYGFSYAPYYERGVAAVRNVAQDYHREDAHHAETSMVVPTPYGGYL